MEAMMLMFAFGAMGLAALVARTFELVIIHYGHVGFYEE